MCGFRSFSRQDNHKSEFKMVQLGLQMPYPAFFVSLPVKIIVERHDVKSVRKNKVKRDQYSEYGG